MDNDIEHGIAVDEYEDSNEQTERQLEADTVYDDDTLPSRHSCRCAGFSICPTVGTQHQLVRATAATACQVA